MMDCYCDYEPAEAYYSKMRRARRPHRCCECPGEIRPGEMYEYHFGIHDGSPFYGHTCERCVDLKTWVRNNVPCFCFAHGNLRDDCINAVDDAIYRAPEETKGLKFGLQRRLVERDQFNKQRRFEAATS